MNTHNSIVDIDIEKLQSIENERESTMANPQFQKWCKDMKIGVRVEKREGKDRANDMMRLWNAQSHFEETHWMPEFIRRMY